MTEFTTPTERKSKGRSPSYPAIPLKAAINRAAIIYDREGKHWAPMGSITAHWGYSSPRTGPASTTYAALKKFGLLEEDGSGLDRRGRLTTLGQEVVRSPNPESAIQTAALLPPIHRELWDEYGTQLPSDTTLIWQLLQRGFTETGAKDLVRVYRETINFAALTDETDALPSDNEDLSEPRPDAAWVGDLPPSLRTGAQTNAATYALQPKVPAPVAQQSAELAAQEAGLTRIPIPLIGGQLVTIEGRFPIDDQAWLHLKAVLDALKPGLVASADGNA